MENKNDKKYSEKTHQGSWEQEGYIGQPFLLALSPLTSLPFSSHMFSSFLS